MKIGHVIKRAMGGSPRLGELLRAADSARDRSDWSQAASLYRAVLAREPGRVDIQVQLGHMLKECGDFGGADAAYQAALSARPDDDDLHLMLGHLRKRQGDFRGAGSYYRRALELSPESPHAKAELQRLDSVLLPAAAALLREDRSFEECRFHTPEDALPQRPPPESSARHDRSSRDDAEWSVPSLFALEAAFFDRPVASFDLFDTLLRRRFLAVNEVHDTVSAYALALLGRYGAENPGQITLERYTVTNLLKTSPHAANEEPGLVEVWTELLAARCARRDEAARLATQVARFEFDIDLENLVAIDGARELLERLCAQGKRVIAISDMYFSGAQIDAILQRTELRHYFERVFVSSDFKATKQTGRLFRIAFDALGICADQMVHIGDNRRSDVELPQSLGVAAVHIDHVSAMPLQRPPYGRRADIHVEIADLLKLFNFQLLLHAKSSRSDQLYFLSRDGCLIRQALETWNSPLVEQHFSGMARADLFLNRAASCWLGVNFQGDWLTEAIGLAFWLHYGQATARQISALLGIEDVPETLGATEYRAKTDTVEVVSAYKAAGLVDCIRSSIIDKRRLTARYLHDAGFFSHAHVTICDVGYSGTVVRDLNTWLLQESPSSDKPYSTAVEFHVIAASHNYEGNARRSAPNVVFGRRPILPAALLPQPLLDSFAWLELFFKHPTYGPLLGYREIDGVVSPVFDIRSDPGASHPATKVLAHSMAEPSDIALLWMAAIDFPGQFRDPLIERFLHPDDALIRQMAGELYEIDAVGGHTRSIVFGSDSIPMEDVATFSASRDFWIPGSLKASAALRRQPATPFMIEVEAMHQTDEQTEFDPVFYREFYDDTRWLPGSAAIRAHYENVGRREGRYPSSRSMLSALRAAYGETPPFFDPISYLWANPDIARHDPPKWHGVLHYLKIGRAQERPIHPDLSSLDEEFEQLLADDALRLKPLEASAWQGGQPARAIVFARQDVACGPWITMFHLAEFIALNHDWCGVPASRAEALIAFLESGVQRIAPLSLEATFDPVFYKATYCAGETLSDEAAYRRWLSGGCVLNHAISEAARLKGLIGTSEFPPAFQWEKFRSDTSSQLYSDASRLTTLEVFLALDDVVDGDFVAGEQSHVVWEAVARHANARGQPGVAERAYGKALIAGAPEGRVWHHLGDLALRDRRFVEAVAAYRRGLAAPNPDRWSYVNVIAACCEIGAFSAGFDFLDAAIPVWKDMEPLRRVRSRLLHGWFQQSYRRLESDLQSKAAVDPSSIVDRFSREFAARASRYVTSGLSLGHGAPRIALLTGRDLREAGCMVAVAHSSAGPVCLFREAQIHEFEESLVGASIAVFHEVECSAETVSAVLKARGLGIETVFWSGDLGRLWSFDLTDMVPGRLLQSAPAVPAPTLRTTLLASFVDVVVGADAAALSELDTIVAGGVAHRLPAQDLPHEIRGIPSTVLLRMPTSVGRPVTAGTTEAIIAAEAVLPITVSGDALAEVLERLPQLHLLFDGPVPDGLRRFAKRARAVNGLHGMTLPARIVDAIIDLGDRAMRSWVMAAESGIPCIIPAAQTVSWLTEGSNVLCADTVQAAVSHLERLMAGDSLSRSIGSGARQAYASRFPMLPREPVGHPRHRRNDRRRILYANVFFPPQTTGGATRVLKDNVDTMIDHGSERFDIAAFCSDDENDQIGAQRVDSYRGMPVFRIATPMEVDMDWRTYNSQVGAHARRVLSLFDPDLVHIHCLPRLTVAFAEACRDLGKPYVVTLHDAWWLSDYPFLVDEDGKATPPAADPVRQSYSKRIGLGLSLDRAGRLRRALHGAQARLSVSEAFASVYRNAGFEVETIENGVSEFAHLPRKMTQGRVRLGHLGGLQHHKGAYLIEAALRSTSFDNLSFTVVELGRAVADEVTTLWGTTPVTVTGKVPANQVSSLYANLDVLIAPSTWPESFGLVTREAAAAGLWIIASDQGAMGDVVTHGENGFLIDTTTPAELVSVLREIDRNVERFQTPPPKRILRSASEQGLDLIRLYDRILSS